MSRQFNNYVKRGGRWYVRIMVPKDLRALYGRSEVVRALGTGEFAEASLKGFNLLTRIRAGFEVARAKGVVPPDSLDVPTASFSMPTVASAHEHLYSASLFTDARRAVRGPVPTIMEAFEQYADENSRKIKADTMIQHRRAVRLFSEFMGKEPLVTSINKNAVRGWRNALNEWPVQANAIAELKGKAFPEALLIAREIWGARALVCIQPPTINRHLNAVSRLCDWLISSTDYMDENPVTGLHLNFDKTENKGPSFSPSQLSQLFGSPVFTGCKTSKLDHLPGDMRVGDHRFWLPLMALYSGARLGELAQLLTEDVKQVEGHWVFHITEEGCATKTTKTKGSERIVPVHSHLIKLGFLNFHLERVLCEERRLFPEIIADKRGQISGRPSKWFGKYLKKMKLKQGTRLKFHSFRHTAIDALRRAGYTNEEMAPLWGHSQPGMTARYGSEAVLTVKQRKKMIEDISYDLDLSHLGYKAAILQAA